MNIALRITNVEGSDITSFGKDGPKYDEHVLLCTRIHHFDASADSAGRTGLRHDDAQKAKSNLFTIP